MSNFEPFDYEDIEHSKVSFTGIQRRVSILERAIIDLGAGSTITETRNANEESITDHNTLSGLLSDDHLQYLLIDGTREMSGDLDMDNVFGITNVASIIFNTSPSVVAVEGMLNYNAIDKVIEWQTDTDTRIQGGTETVVRIINKTGGLLANGTVVFIDGFNVTANRNTAAKADASTWELSQRTIGVMTSDVADDAEGFVTVIGLVRDLDTSGMTAGDVIYLSETLGEFTTTKPTSPAFIIELGRVGKADVSEGYIFLHVNNNDDYGFFNGSFIESFDLTVAEDTGNIVASLQRSGGGNLTMRFGSDFSTLTTPPMTKNLTAGTAIAPQANYLYVLESDQTQITLDLNGYPTDVAHIKVAKVVVLTAAITATDDALANQNVNDHMVDNINMGHSTHYGEWIRSQPATHVSGVEGDSTTGDDYLEITTVPDAVHVKIQEGKIRQLHLQTYPAQDTSGSDFIYVVNDPDANYAKVTELIAGITKLSTGAAISNNKYFAIVLFGIQNKSGERSQLMCNVPGGQYNTQVDTENDPLGHTNFDIPEEFHSTGFLICKLVVQKKASTWEWKSTRDLRKPGRVVSGVSGGGAGTDTTAIHDNVAAEISAIANKAAPVDADFVLIEDSEASNAKKHITLSQIISEAQRSALHARYLDSEAVGAMGALGDGNPLNHNKTVNTDINWSAAVVPQAEAEAGIATTERKWTAERVAQAIAALETGGATPNHNALGGLNDGDVYEHISAAQVGALHDIFVPGVVTAHSDVSNAGSGIIISTAERTALHPAVSALAALDTNMTGAELDDLTLFESGNAQYWPCILEGDSADAGRAAAFGGVVKNLGSGGMNLSFVLPLPPVKNGLSLTITDVRIVLFDADASPGNFVTQVRVFSASNVAHTVDYSETDNLTAPGVYTSGSGVMGTLTNYTLQVNDRAAVQVTCTNPTTEALDIAGVFLRCYYS